MTLRRTAVCAVALIVSAWFVLGVVQAHNIDRATAALSASGKPTAREAAQVRGWLHTASLLNPDTTVELLRGQLALALARPEQAQRLFESVTRSEPQNLAAWVDLGHASSDNPRLFRSVLAHVRELVPLMPGR